MCDQTPTFQGQINAILEHDPGRMISGWDINPALVPRVKHVMNFYDPAVVPTVCRARASAAVKTYRFDVEDYADILLWLTLRKTIELSGEPQGGVPEVLKPAGWRGV